MKKITSTPKCLKTSDQEQEDIEERKKLGAAYVKVRDVVNFLDYLGESFAAGAKKFAVELFLPKDLEAPTVLFNKEYSYSGSIFSFAGFVLVFESDQLLLYLS